MREKKRNSLTVYQKKVQEQTNLVVFPNAKKSFLFLLQSLVVTLAPKLHVRYNELELTHLFHYLCMYGKHSGKVYYSSCETLSAFCRDE